MGPPLVLAAFGDGATLPAAMILAFDARSPFARKGNRPSGIDPHRLWLSWGIGEGVGGVSAW